MPQISRDFQSIRLGKKWHISFLMYYSGWGLWQFRNHDLNYSSFMHQLWQHVQADKHLSSMKAQPFDQWCASDQDLPLCLSVPIVNSELPSKAAIHGTMARSAGISLFWATAPVANMNCFTHMSITGLTMYKEPRMPNVCTENWVSFAVHM